MLLIIVLLLAFPLHPAKAWDPVKTVSDVFGGIGDTIMEGVRDLIEKAVFGLMGAFASLFALILKFMVNILEYVMGPSFNNGIIRQPFVQEGWTIVRDFANMFFVVVLVIIAIATILRQENFGIRKTLPTLIIIALLVNFSLVLVGFVVDVSQVFMVYFLKAFDDKNFGTVLANAAQFDKVFSGQIQNTTDMGAWEEIGVRFVLKALTLLALLFEILIVAVLAVLFIVRSVILWVVAILAPLAFVSYILPQTRGLLWKKWLKALLDWSFFGPVAVFFLFLMGKLSENLQDPAKMANFGTGAGGLSELSASSGFLGSGTPFIQAAAIFVFLFLAINSAKMFTGAVGAKVAGQVEKYGRGAVGAVTAPARWAGQKAVEKGKEEARIQTRGVRERLERIPVVGGLAGGPGAAEAEAKTHVNKRAAQLKGRSTQNLRKMLDMPGTSKVDKAAIMNTLAERKKLRYQDAKHMAQAAHVGADVDKILNTRPDFGIQLNKTEKEVTSKLRPEEIKEIQNEAFIAPRGKFVVGSLNGFQWDKLAGGKKTKGGSAMQKAAAKHAMDEAMKDAMMYALSPSGRKQGRTAEELGFNNANELLARYNQSRSW